MIAAVLKIKRIAPGFWLALFLISALAATTAAAGEATSWSGEVVGVKDGDTIVVLHDGRGETIRLYGIDAPLRRVRTSEIGQSRCSQTLFLGRSLKSSPWIPTDMAGLWQWCHFLEDIAATNGEIITLRDRRF